LVRVPRFVTRFAAAYGIVLLSLFRFVRNFVSDAWYRGLVAVDGLTVRSGR